MLRKIQADCRGTVARNGKHQKSIGGSVIIAQKMKGSG